MHTRVARKEKNKILYNFTKSLKYRPKLEFSTNLEEIVFLATLEKLNKITKSIGILLTLISFHMMAKTHMMIVHSIGVGKDPLSFLVHSSIMSLNMCISKDSHKNCKN